MLTRIVTREDLPYWDSDLANAVSETRRASFVDIDGTMTWSSNNDPSSAELTARKEARGRFEGRSGSAFVTMRTPELLLSQSTYEEASGKSLLRPPPLWKEGAESDKRVYTPLETLPKFDSCLDPPAMGASGLIGLRHGGSQYAFDNAYMKRLAGWHELVVGVLQYYANDDGLMTEGLVPIENPSNYMRRKTDVYPLEYRVQLQWTGPDAAEKKERAKCRLKNWRHILPRELRFIDESRPREERYVLYLLPPLATKERTINHMLMSVVDATAILPSQMEEVFICGDQIPDLRAGFLSAPYAKVTFLLVGGSPVWPYLVGEMRGKRYAGEDIAWMAHALKEGETDEPGVYRVKSYVPQGKPRDIYIGDRAYPGTRGPETIIAHLRKKAA